jgi:hypothetical protein
MDLLRLSSLLAVCLLGGGEGGYAAVSSDTATVTVVASGETHGMLKPCDCPNNPGGGLAERAAAIRSLGAGAALLLLDAGGFAGGGIYDDYTGGRAADSVKTAVTIRAMGAMRYDAATPGDDDLQYGALWLKDACAAANLPLVSANCTRRDGRIFPAFRVVVKSGIRFAITGVVTEERLFPRDESCVVEPPLASLRAVWRAMADSADYRIILSHLGEEATMQLADSFPDADIIVNGHRKSSQDAVTLRGRTIVMQFGYEGKRLSSAAVKFSKPRRPAVLLKDTWLDIGPKNGVDPAVGALLADSSSVSRRQVYDLYIMGECPYGCTALREFVDFVGKFPEIEWNVWFIGSAGGDSLSSLHGPDEVRDEMTWLAVRALYPGRWLSFLDERSKPQATSDAAVAALGLDAARLGRWVAAKGREALADEYRRSTRLGVSASPTLYIDNAPFTKAITAGRLAKDRCADLGETSARCDSLPECFEDGDCRKSGSIGRCSPQGRCEFKPDAPFSFTALVADSSLGHPESSVIATTGELFPNATIRTLRLHSAEGLKMLKTWAPSSLPFYLFGKGAGAAQNFPQVEGGLEKRGDDYVFRDGITPKNYFLDRAEKPGSIVFFIDPLVPDAVAAMKRVLDDSLLSGRVRILPIFYADPAAPANATEEKVRREEALRWLVMDSLHRDRFAPYLRAYAANPGSSNWLPDMANTGMTPDSLFREGERYGGVLTAQFDLLDRLGIRDPMAVLLDNRHVAAIKNETDFAGILNDLKRKNSLRP